MGEITWSHSRLNCIINNPAEYYLIYEQGIKPVMTKPALAIGSAVHWGIEHETDDLSEYFNKDSYDGNQLLCEAMANAYLRKKDDIYKELLRDGDEILKIEDEYHELDLSCRIPSKLFKDGHKFMGIIDLLLLTKKGWILVDYKTSSKEVDWETYISQLYKYKYILKDNFPNVPLFKVAIINIQKTGIRRKKDENEEVFKMRLKDQYIVDENLINFHIYENKDFDENTLNNYINDLSGLIDIARVTVENHLYAINYSNIVGLYGESDYANVMYGRQDKYSLYKIKDTVFDDFDGVLKERLCDPIDMLVLKHNNVLNKYEKYKELKSRNLGLSEEDFEKQLKKEYICSDDLLQKYYTNFLKKI